MTFPTKVPTQVEEVMLASLADSRKWKWSTTVRFCTNAPQQGCGGVSDDDERAFWALSVFLRDLVYSYFMVIIMWNGICMAYGAGWSFLLVQFRV